MRRNDFVEIMEMLDKRLNDKGKNWRHVFKVRVGSSVRSAYPCLLSTASVSPFSTIFFMLAQKTLLSTFEITSTSSKHSKNFSILMNMVRIRAQMFVRRPRTSQIS